MLKKQLTLIGQSLKVGNIKAKNYLDYYKTVLNDNMNNKIHNVAYLQCIIFAKVEANSIQRQHNHLLTLVNVQFWMKKWMV